MDEADDPAVNEREIRPQSTQEQLKKGKMRSLTAEGQPPTTLAQFSFAPTTQTTVVTTTTTTTTRFPPLLVRPPKNVDQLDPKLYPLASSPTPAALRNISFTLGGKSTVFRESEDATVALEQFREERRMLRSGKGSIRTVESFEPWVETDPSKMADPMSIAASQPHQRPASPESIPDTDEHGDLVGESSRQTKRRRISSATSTSQPRPSLQSHPRIRGMRPENPVTPESQPRAQRASRRSARVASQGTRETGAPLPSPSLEQLPSFQRHEGMNASVAESENGRPLRSRNSQQRDVSQETTVPTPPIESDESGGHPRSLNRRALSSIPARLHVNESPSGQDGSLPSPSLSPVTAAANLQHNGYFAPVAPEAGLQHSGYFADVDSNSEMGSQSEFQMFGQSALREPTPTKSSFDPPRGLQIGTEQPSSTLGSFSVDQIPVMLEYFEALPDELKGYVMHQLLRRCPKPTLHIVADVVNPALKCDFLAILPPELGLNIVRYLDRKSLCRAAQVSKKWRQIINGDEQVWKDLFDADGFVLPEGEMEQAIAEGWGWQDPSGPDGFEADFQPRTAIKSESDSRPSSADYNKGLTGILRRSKRKAASMLSNRSKPAKRRCTSRDTSVDQSSNWWDAISTAEGPYAAANAAALAVPAPNTGLRALRGLHLHKSLYRRHYLIRKNWMYEETKPRHIAFRAHDTHVVTCLQFDTDKILTGSDDNNINVYDTRTGALRARLVGHEGGVWALQYEGNTLVSGSTDRSVRVWDIEKGEERQVFRGHTSTVRCLQVVMPVKVGENSEGKPIMTPRQPLIITGSRDSTLRIWRLPRPEDPTFIQLENDTDADDCPYFIRTLTGHQHSVRAIAAHADTLVSGSYDCTVRVWKISTGETVHRLQGHTQKVYSVVLDHERNRCISGSMDNMVRIWSLDTGSPIYTLEGHTSLVGLLDLNAERLVSAAADSTLRIWDPETGQCKATLSAHTGAITCFQHDGQKVISGSDRTLKLWDVKTGECKKDLLSELSGVWQVKFEARRCVAAVQRDGVTFIEVLDFGAARDGVLEGKRGRRIVVDVKGNEIGMEDGEVDGEGVGEQEDEEYLALAGNER